MKVMIAALALFLGVAEAAAQRPPIIDMHLHARRANYTGDNPPPMCAPFAIMPRSDSARGVMEGLTFSAPPCEHPIPAGSTDEQVMRQSIALMERYNIIGMVSGEPELMAIWRRAAPQRIIPGLDFRLPGTPGARHVAARSPAELRSLHRQGVFQVLGEIMAQYEGVAPNDPRLEPYWALAEELDFPVGIHMGPGGPAEPYGRGGYRVALGNPLLLEEVLVRHPRLRLYIMHAGYPMAAELRALMFSHPQVYVDLGGIVYTEPRVSFYRFLQGDCGSRLWGPGDVRLRSDDLARHDRGRDPHDRRSALSERRSKARHFLQQCCTVPAPHAPADSAAPRSPVIGRLAPLTGVPRRSAVHPMRTFGSRACTCSSLLTSAFHPLRTFIRR